MATRGNRDANAVGECSCIFVFGFVQFKSYVGKVIQLWNCIPLNLGLDPTFEYAIDKGLNV